MSAILRRAERATLLFAVALLGLSLLTPLVSLAQTSFTTGDTAVVSSGGGSVNVRADADPNADSLGQIPDGTDVFIMDGPYTAADGSLWYRAGVWDLTGYINASMLDSVSSTTSGGSTSTDEAQSPDSTTSSIPWKQPIDYGVVVDNVNAPLPADGLACRVEASGSASTIVRLVLGQAVEVTGQTVWAEGVEFLPINCQGVGGFVKADYIALNSAQAPAPTEDVVAAATEEAPAEDVVATEDPNAPVAGDVIVTVLDQNGAAVPGACFALYQHGAWVAETCDSSDAIPNNGNSGFFALPAGSYTLVASSIPGSSANNQEVWVTAGDTAYVTVSVTADAPVATEEATVPEVTEEVVTEEAVTEETVTEEAATGEAEATEEAEAPEDATDEPVTEEPATGEAEATDEADATEEPVTEEVTEEVATDDDAVTETPDSTLGEPIGDATVTGTNGEGIRCRVAPDSSAATITVLSEGTTVFVYAEPVNGYLEIGCGGEIGYGDVNYLWAGGAGEEIPANADSVVVVGTGGLPLNCRAGAGTSFAVIGAVAQGTVLTSRGASTNGWAPVVCNGQNGFVSISYVEPTSGSSNPGTSNPDTGTGGAGGNGTVSNTGGDGLRCRTSAPSGSIITVLPEGTVLTTRGAASNGWVPVVCSGQNGFVSAQYFTVGSDPGTNPAPTPPPTQNPDPGTSSGYVKVTGTGGASLNCRTAASMSGMVITAIPFGSTVATRGAASNGWVPVTCASKAGYVSATYITATTDPGNGGGGTTPTPTPDPDNGGGTTGSAVVTGTGSSLRCRTAANASASIITSLVDGTTVTTRGASSNGWTPVVCGGQNGFMSSEYLSTSGGGTTPPPTQTPPPSSGSGMVNGDHGKVTARANMRYQASLSANVMIVVDAGEVLLITGNATNGFYPVNYDGLQAFMAVELLNKTSEPLSKRGGSGNDPNPSPPPGDGGGGSATGNALVNYAMRYVGYPYVAAGRGPSSFDCSGFTYWVVKNVMGRDIGSGLWTQTVAGTSVSRSNLQPGDLVFFQNTYKAGLSHVGLYIGNNQFVHAENENTGVVVSSLGSNYYSSRWYGAVRLG